MSMMRVSSYPRSAKSFAAQSRSCCLRSCPCVVSWRAAVTAQVQRPHGSPVNVAETPAGRLSAMAGSNRTERLESHERNPKWQNAPFLIDMSICINCDTCLRHCPQQFGAIFNHGIDVIILPELCSGCGKCLPPVCPVDCIIEDPQWTPSPDDWWHYPYSGDDPYA